MPELETVSKLVGVVDGVCFKESDLKKIKR